MTRNDFLINYRFLDYFLKGKKILYILLPEYSVFFIYIIIYLLICFMDKNDQIFLISMTEVDLGPFQVLQEMCFSCSSIFQRNLDTVWLSCMAAIDLIIYIDFFCYFLLFCLIFSANTGICLDPSLEWCGSSHSACGEWSVLCQCPTLIVGLVIFCKGSA